MQPYTVSENEWISKVPLTVTGSVDIVALEHAARRERARMVGALFLRLVEAWKRRAHATAQAAEVQRQVDRAALGIGR